MTENTVTLNVWDSNKGFAMAVEGENGSRYLKIKLVDENGPIDLSEKLAQFLAKKPDGTIIYNTMEIKDALGGIVGINITEQMSTVTGVLEDCEINILDLNRHKLVAKKLDLLIKPSIGPEIEESVSEMTVVRDLITKVANLENHAADLNNPHSVNCNQVEAVPLHRKINNKELSSDVTLTNIDVNAAAVNHNHYLEDINFTNPLPISLGGTGAADQLNARNNLGIYKTYTSLEGIINYPCTTKEVLNAIPEKSTLILNVISSVNSITDLPASNGLLTIIKDTNSSFKILYNHLKDNQSDVSSLYIGRCIKNSEEGISWHNVLTDEDIIPVSKGGTGATTASSALENLGVYKIYTSLDEIINTPCTTVALLNALPNKSTLILNISSNVTTVSDLPDDNGILVINKDTLAKTNIFYNHLPTQSTDDISFYIGAYRTDIIPSCVTWSSLLNNNSIIALSNGGTGATSASGAVQNLKESLIDLIYPVGSYYFSSSSTSPQNLFGGTWEQIKDKFILAAGDTYTVGATGGSATHTLTVNEIPSHRHTTGPSSNAAYGGNSGDIQSGSGWKTALDKIYTGYSGGGSAHNNMPPYLVAYCWHRIS